MRIAYLDGPRLRRSLMAGCDHVETQRRELNRINVFPVPDGDTGTNLALTVRAIRDHLGRDRSSGAGGVAREAAEAAVLGARGNSGMMLARFLLGFADDVEALERIEPARCARAMSAGIRSLDQAIDHPVEGTILPVLKTAGVVDAGAKGFVHLLEGIAEFVALVTESAHDLPEAVIRAHGIHVVPLLLLEGDQVHRDGVDITATEFHDRMDGGGEIPTTSQPAPADFLAAFHRAAEEGEEILYVGLSAALSGTFASAEAAAGRFDGVPVHRFDRLLASGRVSWGRAWLGGLLNIKPILGLTADGRIELVGKARGRQRLLPAVLDRVVQRVPSGGAPVRFGVVHVGCPEVVDQVKQELRARYGDVEILDGPATPVLATHLGPGAWGLAYMVEDEPGTDYEAGDPSTPDREEE